MRDHVFKNRKVNVPSTVKERESTCMARADNKVKDKVNSGGKNCKKGIACFNDLSRFIYNSTITHVKGPLHTSLAIRRHIKKKVVSSM